MRDDKRIAFPFGYHLLSPLSQVRYRGVEVELASDGGTILASPREKLTPEVREILTSKKAEIIEELRDEKKTEAMDRLREVSFEGGPIQLREMTLLEVEPGRFLAVTEEELATLGSSATTSARGGAGGQRSPKSSRIRSEPGTLFSESESPIRTLKGG